jgi:hypothetical protein
VHIATQIIMIDEIWRGLWASQVKRTDTFDILDLLCQTADIVVNSCNDDSCQKKPTRRLTPKDHERKVEPISPSKKRVDSPPPPSSNSSDSPRPLSARSPSPRPMSIGSAFEKRVYSHSPPSSDRSDSPRSLSDRSPSPRPMSIGSNSHLVSSEHRFERTHSVEDRRNMDDMDKMLTRFSNSSMETNAPYQRLDSLPSQIESIYAFNHFALMLNDRNALAKRLNVNKRISSLFLPVDNVHQMVLYTSDLRTFSQSANQTPQLVIFNKLKKLRFDLEVIKAELRNHCIDGFGLNETKMYMLIKSLIGTNLKLLANFLVDEDLRHHFKIIMRKYNTFIK